MTQASSPPIEPDPEKAASCQQLLEDLQGLRSNQDVTCRHLGLREVIDRDGWPPTSVPGRAERELLAALRVLLARVADANYAGLPTSGARRAVLAALDGAQLTARTELLHGDGGDSLRRLIPSFVYLVVLPLGEREAALRAASQVGRELTVDRN